MLETDSPLFSPQDPYFYANNSMLLLSPLDVRIVFAECITQGVGLPMHVSKRCSIVFSFPELKRLARALTTAVDHVERAIGGPIQMYDQETAPAVEGAELLESEEEEVGVTIPEP